MEVSCSKTSLDAGKSMLKKELLIGLKSVVKRLFSNETIRLVTLRSPSETAPKSGGRLALCANKREGLDFRDWLTGFTDGDGCFKVYTNKENKKITLTFKIGQKSNNAQILYRIKKVWGVGSVTKEKGGSNMTNYLIRDKGSLKACVIPHFSSSAYSLISSKRHDFLFFKEAMKI